MLYRGLQCHLGSSFTALQNYTFTVLNIDIFTRSHYQIFTTFWLSPELQKESQVPQRFINLRPNITSYQVCMEDCGGNGGKSEFRQRTTKYYQFQKFGEGRIKHLDLGTTSANTCFYPQTAVVPTNFEHQSQIEQSWLRKGQNHRSLLVDLCHDQQQHPTVDRGVVSRGRVRACGCWRQ